MRLGKPLIITIGLFLSAGSLPAVEVQEGGKFLLLTTEEAAALQEKLSSVQGEEREALRQAEYQRLKLKAEQAGYQVPPMTKAAPAEQAATPPAPSAPAPAPEKPVAAPPPAATASAPPPEATPVSPAPAPVTQAAEATAATTEPPANEAQVPDAVAAPVVKDYQNIRQSHDELVKSMEARRDALRAQMQKRREEIARERTAMAKRHMTPEASQRYEAQEADMAARQKQIEEQKQARIREMEARRKAMEARINSGINAIGRPAARPYYPPRAGWAPRYGYPYAPYGYPRR